MVELMIMMMMYYGKDAMMNIIVDNDSPIFNSTTTIIIIVSSYDIIITIYAYRAVEQNAVESYAGDFSLSSPNVEMLSFHLIVRCDSMGPGRDLRTTYHLYTLP